MEDKTNPEPIEVHRDDEIAVGDTEKATKKSLIFNPIFISIFLALVLVTSIIIYRLSPAYYKRIVLKNSTVVYTVEKPTGGKYSQNIVYTLKSMDENPTITAEWKTINGKPGKIERGKIPPERYLSLFMFFDELTRGEIVEKPVNNVEVYLGTKKKNIGLSSAYQKLVNLKFEILRKKFIDEVDLVDFKRNTQIKRLAGRVKLESNLGSAPELKSLLFNRDDGELMVYQVRTEKLFETGKYNLIASNYEGLGLVVESGGTLAFWEKKNLQNKTRVLARMWDVQPPYRKVLVTRDSVYFMKTSTEEGYDLMRYDYINRKIFPVVHNTKLYLKDVTSDGKYLLLLTPARGEGFEVVEAKTARKLKVDPALLSSPSMEIFSFYRGPRSFLTAENGIIRSAGQTPEEYKVEISAKSKKFEPIVYDKETLNLLCVDPEKSVYYIFNLPQEEETLVDDSPMELRQPVFFPAGDGFYFLRFDDLFRWTAPEAMISGK